MLARRDLSEGEVRFRLAEKGYPEAEIEEAVLRLRELRYLDDAGLARAIADARSTGRLDGPKRIIAYLETRRLPSTLIREAVAAAFAGDAERVLAARARAKLEPEADRRARRPATRKKKGAAVHPARVRREFLLRRLLARGFSWEAALSALEPGDDEREARDPEEFDSGEPGFEDSNFGEPDFSPEPREEQIR